MNTVKLSDKHLAVISNALEVYYRLKSGQVGIALDTAYDYKLSWEQKEVVEKQIKLMLFPELHSNAAYGFNSDKIGDAKVAYEVKKTFEEFLSVKNNDGCWGTGTNFRGPLKASDEPFPDILDFKKYKDYPLNKTQSKKINKFYEKKEFDLMWDFIDSLKLDLPRGEKTEILFGSFVGDGRRVHVPNDRVIIRVHKPIKEKQ